MWAGNGLDGIDRENGERYMENRDRLLFEHDIIALALSIRGSFSVPTMSKQGIFPGKNRGSGHPKCRRGFSGARFWTPKMLGIGPVRIDLRVFGSQNLDFEVDFGRFRRFSQKNL